MQRILNWIRDLAKPLSPMNNEVGKSIELIDVGNRLIDPQAEVSEERVETIRNGVVLDACDSHAENHTQWQEDEEERARWFSLHG